MTEHAPAASCDRCFENISKCQPPRPCPAEFCRELFEGIAELCVAKGLPYDTPVPMLSPDGNMCWCCCDSGCGTTAVATEPGVYRPLEALRRGDTVLSTGPELARWTPAEIHAMAVPQQLDGALLSTRLVFRRQDGERRIVVVSSETLVMLSDGRLKTVCHLDDDDVLRTADGGEAALLYRQCLPAAVALPYLGPVDAAEPLSGHLLDVLGLVCADFGVSTAAYAGALPSELVVAPPADLEPIRRANERE